MRRDLRARLARGPARPRGLVLSRACVLDPGPGSTPSTTSSSATARSPSWPRPGEATLAGAEEVDAEGMHVFPAFFDPHVHLRTPGGEDAEDVETGSRAAAAGGYCGILAMANTEPPVDTAADISALRERAAAEASVPVGFLATVTRGDGGRGADRDGGAARRGRGRLLRRRAADPQRPGAAARAPVPAPGGPSDRPARGGPGAVGRRGDARGRRSRRCSGWRASRRSRSRR